METQSLYMTIQLHAYFIKSSKKKTKKKLKPRVIEECKRFFDNHICFETPTCSESLQKLLADAGGNRPAP